jgi:hypothetical protein
LVTTVSVGRDNPGFVFFLAFQFFVNRREIRVGFVEKLLEAVDHEIVVLEIINAVMRLQGAARIELDAVG